MNNKIPVVKLSNSESGEVALKYAVSILNLKIVHLDFAYSKAKKVYTFNKIIKSSNFVNDASIQEDNPSFIHNYGLRKRKRDNYMPSLPAKRPRNEIIPKTYAPKLITAPRNVLKQGLVVIAKMKTYAAWPARIVSFLKTVVTVQFFGDDDIGNVS